VTDIFILNEMRAQDEICILVNTLLGCNMKHALFHNLNITKMDGNWEKYVINVN
jgi:hypothetical protein